MPFCSVFSLFYSVFWWLWLFCLFYFNTWLFIVVCVCPLFDNLLVPVQQLFILTSFVHMNKDLWKIPSVHNKKDANKLSLNFTQTKSKTRKF